MRLAIGLLIAGAWAGCANNVPCPQMTSTDGVAKDAQSFRLAAYPESASCDALPEMPIEATTKNKGESLKLSIKPGTYLFVVTAFAKPDGVDAIGRSCSKQKAGSGASVCFNIAVEQLAGIDLLSGDFASVGDMTKPPDLNVGADLADMTDTGDMSLPDDMTVLDFYLPPPPDLKTADLTKTTCTTEGELCPNEAGTCCGGVCVDTQYDPANCGGCGRICATTDVSGPTMCSLGVCSSECVAQRGNCTLPPAPTADDGCETNTTVSVSHCGGCNQPCNVSPANNTARSCGGSGVCSYTCAANRQDCSTSGANVNGCECEGTACCGANCQTKHSPGPANTKWYDCDPLATYNVEQATEACQAVAGAAGCTAKTCNGSTSVVCFESGLACGCWAYDGAGKGKYVYALAVPGLLCLAGCPSASSAVWQ